MVHNLNAGRELSILWNRNYRAHTDKYTFKVFISVDSALQFYVGAYDKFQ
jgi:hypothetical protein